MTSLAAARTRLALPVATVVNRGIALGVLTTIPPLVLLGPFGFGGHRDQRLAATRKP